MFTDVIVIGAIVVTIWAVLACIVSLVIARVIHVADDVERGRPAHDTVAVSAAGELIDH